MIVIPLEIKEDNAYWDPCDEYVDFRTLYQVTDGNVDHVGSNNTK